MAFCFNHFNFNVTNLETSLAFYEKALGLKENGRIEAEDGSYVIVYLGDGKTGFRLELPWLKTIRRNTIWASANFTWQ